MENKKAFTYEIQEHFGTVSNSGTMSMELNLIAYSGGSPKYDLRKWRMIEGEKKMQKGITMTGDELIALRTLLNSMEVK